MTGSSSTRRQRDEVVRADEEVELGGVQPLARRGRRPGSGGRRTGIPRRRSRRPSGAGASRARPRRRADASRSGRPAARVERSAGASRWIQVRPAALSSAGGVGGADDCDDECRVRACAGCEAGSASVLSGSSTTGITGMFAILPGFPASNGRYDGSSTARLRLGARDAPVAFRYAALERKRADRGDEADARPRPARARTAPPRGGSRRRPARPCPRGPTRASAPRSSGPRRCPGAISATSAWCAGPWKHSPTPKIASATVITTNAAVASSQ